MEVDKNYFKNPLSFYVDNNKQLILLNNKKPMYIDWRNKREDALRVKAHIKNGGSFGRVIAEDELVIDVDYRNGGKDGLSAFVRDFPFFKCSVKVDTPNGEHYYTKIPKQYANKISFNVPCYDGVDFVTFGRYVVCAGSIVNGKKYKFSEASTFEDYKKELLNDVILKKIENNRIQETEEETKENIKEIKRLTKKEILELLSYVSNNMPNIEWIKVGSFLKTWNDVDGLKLFNQWSKGGETYEAGECKRRWKSFKLGLVGVNYFYKKAGEKRVDKTSDRLYNKLLTEKELKSDEVDSLLDGLGFKEKKEIKKNIEDKITKSGEDVATFDLDNLNSDYFDDWLYIEGLDLYANKSSRKTLSRVAFINATSHALANEKIKSPVTYMNIYRHKASVDNLAYLPNEKECVVCIDSEKFFNAFKADTLTKPASVVSDGVRVYLRVFLNHLKMLCNGDDVNKNYLFNFIAHNIKYYGVKINWSPIIQSIQGLGKSFIAEFLSACLGFRNVGVVSSESFKSSFDGWQIGKIINVCHELKISYNDNDRVLTRLKSAITDPTVSVNKKNLNQFETFNKTNYIFFTNHANPITLDASERRFFYIKNELESISEFEARYCVKSNHYFKILFDGLNKYKHELVAWFNNYVIPDEFYSNMTAPKTDAFNQMQHGQELRIPYLEEFENVLNLGLPFICKEYIIKNKLKDELARDEPNIKHTHISKVLTYKRYYPMKNREEIEGSRLTVWAGNGFSEKVIKDKIKEHKAKAEGIKELI